METYLLIARSITHAQHMSKILDHCGIRAGVFRAPTGLTSRGCSYAVRVKGSQWREARTCLNRADLVPLAVFQSVGDAYREVIM